MYASGHRSTMSTPDLSSVTGSSGRSIPRPMPIDLPEPTSPRFAPSSPSARSPLRNGITIDPTTGSIRSQDGSPRPIDTHDPWGTRSADQSSQLTQSPPASITQFASSFAQRVGSLVSGSISPSAGSGSMHLPTDAELEAEAAREREKSRREAERILNMERMSVSASSEGETERKRVEERVMEMLEASRARPNRSMTTPSPATTPSKDKEKESWWSSAKNKLTPSKDKDKDLTPAQQVIAEAKAKEKEQAKRKSKDYKDWPANANIKYSEPMYQSMNASSLSLPPGARPIGGLVGSGQNVIPASSSQPPAQPQPIPRGGSRTPSPSRTSQTPSHSPSASQTTNNVFKHPNGSMSNLSNMGASPSRSSIASGATGGKDSVPVYAQFSKDGTLDMAGTLLTIARRFEKLERWAVGHVRALEERMGDVEQWLVDKEKEKERERLQNASNSSAPTVGTPSKGSGSAPDTPSKVVREVTIERVVVDQDVKRDVNDMKEELGELRSRMGELGREVSRIATASASSLAGSRPDTPSSEAGPGFGIGRLGTGFGSPTSINTMTLNTMPGPTSMMPTQSNISISHPRALPSIPPTPSHAQHTQSPGGHSIAQSETASIISTASTILGGGRTKLPYPTGDYTSPPGSPPPQNAPTPSLVRQVTGNGIRRAASRQSLNGSNAGTPSGRPMSPTPSIGSVTGSGSGIGRKRYTVALGQPLSSGSSPSPMATPATTGRDDENAEVVKGVFDDNLFSEPPKVELKTAFFSSLTGGEKVNQGGASEEQPMRTESPTPDMEFESDDDHSHTLKRNTTIGKTPINLASLSSPPTSQSSSPQSKAANNVGGANLQRGSPRPSPGAAARARAQSTYGVPGSSTSSISRPQTTTPAETSNEDNKGSWRSRSKSIERFSSSSSSSGSFVDPLVIRKKKSNGSMASGHGSRNSVAFGTGLSGYTSTGTVQSPVAVTATRGRVPFGDLLAFFDAEKANKQRS